MCHHPSLPCSVGTVLFLGFPSLLEPPPLSGPGAACTGLAAVQACMEAVQKRMRQHDGSFLQVGAGRGGHGSWNKGCTPACGSWPGHSNRPRPP